MFGEALRRVQQFGGVNLVIALDPADEHNGGFEVLGRTHKNGIVPLTYDVSRMNHDVFDESHRALPALAPGDAILFHPRLAHGRSRESLEPSAPHRDVVVRRWGATRTRRVRGCLVATADTRGANHHVVDPHPGRSALKVHCA